MASPVKREKVQEWADQALSTLEKARALCTEAQSLLHITAYLLITQLPEKLKFSKFLVDALTQQHKVIKKMIDSTKKKVEIDIDSFNNKLNDELKPSLNQLDNIILQLQYTKIPSFLIEESLQNEAFAGHSTLSEFISVDAISLLKNNIAIYESNGQKLLQLTNSSLNDEVLIYYDHVILKEYNKAVKGYENIETMQLGTQALALNPFFESNESMKTLIKENTSLENELVAILEMLTKHYDQCLQGLSLLEGNPDEVQVNFDVLQVDALELPDVLKELTTIYNVILENESRGKHVIQSSLPQIDSVIATCQDLLQSFRLFKNNNLAKVMILSLAVDDKLLKCSIDDDSNRHPIEVYTETINQLTYHYSQFLEVYKSKYLNELHYEKYVYPRKFLKKLTLFLNEELHQMQKEETERRKKWLSLYGDFIPKEFKLPGEVNQPAIVQVITEGLEEIDKESINESPSDTDEELKLLKLISSNK